MTENFVTSENVRIKKTKMLRLYFQIQDFYFIFFYLKTLCAITLFYILCLVNNLHNGAEVMI